MKLLVCECSRYHLLPEKYLKALFSALEKENIPFVRVPDLCDLCARKNPGLAQFTSEAMIVACHSRAIQWLFHHAGQPLTGTTCLNLRTGKPAAVLEKIHQHPMDPAPEIHNTTETPPPPDWTPWFPVIDYDRCINCGQCQDFCMFDTYSRSSDNKVIVENPWNCKTNCPACARVCPQRAIIFAKYDKEPINGADIIDAPDENNSPDINLDQALDGDIYEKLRTRRTSGKKLLKDKADDKS